MSSTSWINMARNWSTKRRGKIICKTGFPKWNTASKCSLRSFKILRISKDRLITLLKTWFLSDIITIRSAMSSRRRRSMNSILIQAANPKTHCSMSMTESGATVDWAARYIIMLHCSPKTCQASKKNKSSNHCQVPLQLEPMTISTPSILSKSSKTCKKPILWHNNLETFSQLKSKVAVLKARA